jgi:predicted nucleotidyltransferase
MPKKKKSKKKPAVQTDAQGQFIWETYFVGGKQKRQKVRVIDGKPVHDIDEYLINNADDIYLHQTGRWDLMEQRRLEEEAEQPEAQHPEAQHPEGEAPQPAPRAVPINIDELEGAFDHLAFADSDLCDEPVFIFLNLTTGELVWVESGEEAEESGSDKNLLELPEDLHEGRDYAIMEDFISSLEDGPISRKLAQAIGGKGAFRRFRDIVFGGGDVELKYAWNWFETRRKREHIVEWLEACRIAPEWDRDIFEPPPLPDKRTDLLRAVLEFVRDAREIPGVRRIALLGSLVTDKAIPKDVDLLVEVDDQKPLTQLAKVRRQLAGKTMQTGDGCGADVFLCSPRGDYLGRVCQWKKCAPGVRQSCPAQHCGRRKFVCDDLQSVTLDRHLLAEPPLDLWPEMIERTELPEDVRRDLVAPLR